MREENRSNTPVIYLVGIGMGGLGQLTLQGQRAIVQADAVAGAGRMLNSVEKLLSGKQVLECYDAEEISVWLEENRNWIHSGAVLFFRRYRLLQRSKKGQGKAGSIRMECDCHSRDFLGFLFCFQAGKRLAGH